MTLLQSRPSWWPRFTSTVRSTALTAWLGAALGSCVLVLIVTGMLSHYQYSPWSWLPEPASPVWLYRLTQGVHVAVGTLTIPLLLVKLWSVYPNLFRFPPARSVRHAVERGSVFVLVATALVQVTTGFLNTLGWYPFRWDFVSVHRYLGYVLVGSVLLHVAVKLPDIGYGLRARLRDADVLTEIPWDENPDAHSNAGDLPGKPTPAISRRGVLVATGAGVGLVALTTVGQTITPLAPLGLLATRETSRGPQGVPINRLASEAQVTDLATAPDWALELVGPRAFRLGLTDLEGRAPRLARIPVTCVEGWSVGADWQGLSLLELVEEAGGSIESRVHLVSLEPAGLFNHSYLEGPQVGAALLATHLNGERLNLDHGYPLRLICPNRAGVLNTKWLARIEVLS